VERIFSGLFEAASFWEPRRLPELFCGFARRHTAPTMYPVACAPQAWASAAVFSLLASALGITIDGARGEISLIHPMLPPAVGELRITGLEVGSGRIDLLLENHPHDVGLTVLRREGEVRVVTVK